MKVKVESENERAKIYIFGDIDIEGSKTLQQVLNKILTDSSNVEVVIDFKNVRSIFNSGVKVLQTFDKAIKARGGEMMVSNLNPEATEIFCSVDLTKLFYLIKD
jgi:anti-anti-sigma factor